MKSLIHTSYRIRYFPISNSIIRIIAIAFILLYGSATAHCQTSQCEGIDVIYTDLFQVYVDGNLVLPDLEVAIYDYGTFASQNRIPSGQDGFLCFQVTEKGTKKVGLSDSSQDGIVDQVDYGFLLTKSEVEGFVLAAVIVDNEPLDESLFTVQPGDIMQIRREGSELLYFHNGSLIWELNSIDYTQELILYGRFEGIKHNSFGHAKMSHDTIKTDCSLQLATGNVITLCPGDYMQLNVSGADSYLWIPSSGLSCNTCPNPIISSTYGPISSSYAINGYLNSEPSDQPCGYFDLSVILPEACDDPIIGCSFNNFGAAVTVNPGTYLNVHCNLLNETGMTNGVLQKGEFVNDGHIRVELDWINNAYNQLFLTQQGESELFGAFQQMRGNSSTHYFDLTLSGFGPKEMKIDEYAHQQLDLTVNELIAGDYTFYVENAAPIAITHSGGFVSTDGIGYLARQLQASNLYVYPMGSTLGTFRIRPVSLYDAVNAGQYKVGFANRDPVTVDGLVSQAPNVLSINNLFYHRIAAPALSTDIGIRSYFFDPTDGTFQSILHYETTIAAVPPPPYWGSTPVATINLAPLPGYSNVASFGPHDFESEAFVLGQSGFYVNTDDFGNSSGGGTTVTITSPSGSSGGGIGTPDNTGGNTTVGPYPLPGDYTIDITTTDPTTSGGIDFTVGSDGSIDAGSITFTDDTTGEGGDLSTDLYDIDPITNGIILIDTPPELNFSCVNNLEVRMGPATVLVLSAGEDVLINNIDASQIQTLELQVFDQAQTMAYATTQAVSGANLAFTALSLVPGPYAFTLIVTFQDGTQDSVFGHFIAN